MLCDQCGDVFGGDLDPWPEGKGFQRRNEQRFIPDKISEVNGCFICHEIRPRIVTECLSRDETKAHAQAQPCSIIREVKWHDYALNEGVLVLYVNGLTILKRSLVRITNPPNDEIETTVSETTDSPAVMQFASKWLEDCTENHAECHTQKENRFPSRLLEIGSPTEDRLALKHTTDLNERPRYMTLSHCWGDSEFLKLTSETKDQLLRGIPFKSLAKSFQDAAVITRSLGVSYLWIDSLCIFQDSTEDWQRESSIMGDVYHSSFLNIGASGSTTSLEGCFRSRDPRLVQPHIVTISYSHFETARYFLKERPSRSALHGFPYITDQPLLSRGWVVQERLLAPRMLHFGSNYVFWECRRFSASEMFPLGMDLTGQSLKTPENHQSKETVLWQRGVTLYCVSNLTKASDKFIAISGLARHLCSLGGPEDYFAGLWRSTLVGDLLWFRTSPNNHRPSKYQAPSWSWASLEGRTGMNMGRTFSNHKQLIRVVDVQITKMTEDPYGEISDGYLKLIGRVLRMEFDDAVSLPNKKLALSFKEFRLRTPPKTEVFIRMDTPDMVTGTLESTNAFFFLPVIKKGQECWSGLILRASEAEERRYERCGLLSFVRYPGSDQNQSFERILEADSSKSTPSDDWDFPGHEREQVLDEGDIITLI